MAKSAPKEDFREFDVLIAASYETGGIVPVDGTHDPKPWEQAIREAIWRAISDRPLASGIRVVAQIKERRRR